MGIILFVCNMGLYLDLAMSLQENESFGFNMDHSYGFKVSTFSGPHGFFLSKKPGGVWLLTLDIYTHIYIYIIYIYIIYISYIYISHVSICFSVWWSIHVHPSFCWRGRCSETNHQPKNWIRCKVWCLWAISHRWEEWGCLIVQWCWWTKIQYAAKRSHQKWRWTSLGKTRDIAPESFTPVSFFERKLSKSFKLWPLKLTPT